MIRALLAWLLWNNFRPTLRIRGWYIRALILLMGGRCGGRLLVEPGFRFRYPPHEGITIGSGVFFGKNMLIDVPSGGCLQIGDRAWFNMNIVIAASRHIEIGEDVLVAEYTSIRDGDHGTQPGVPIRCQPMSTAPVRIGEGAWIARGVAVLKGATIGAGAVVGAHAVVKSAIPANAIAAGIPARVVRYRDAAGQHVVRPRDMVLS
jgi:acetyltransferase-like isoleucine patch superfamily enzyme